MLEYESNIVLSNEEFNEVGKRPIRHDGAEKVTGQARYGADIRLPGMLHGKVLRSPHGHARIKSIDTRHAEELPGVYAVVTSGDLAQPSGRVVDLAEGVMHNMRFLSNNILAADKVLYKGHAIAAVAATSPHVAERALELIEVDYEELPAVMSADEALKPGAPLLHERLATISNPNMRPGGTLEDDDPTDGSNLSNHFEFRLGDVEQGFREADVVIEHETATAAIHQGYIEPHAATAQWNSDGSLTLWSSSQGHFNVRDQTANLMGVPVSKVKAIQMEIGGGFGAKTLVYLEPVAAALARKAGHPVKVMMSRTEVFEGTGPTSGTQIQVKLGATKDGRFTAAEAHLTYEAGAFPGSPVSPACQCMMSPYDISERLDRGPRCGGQQAQVGGLPGTRRAGRRRMPWKPLSTCCAKSSAWTRWSFACATAPRRARGHPRGRCGRASDSSKPCRRPRITRTMLRRSKARIAAGASPAASGATTPGRRAPPPSSTTTAP